MAARETNPGLGPRVRAFIKEIGASAEVDMRPQDDEFVVLDLLQKNLLKKEAGSQALRRALAPFAAAADFVPKKDIELWAAEKDGKRLRLTYADLHDARNALETQRFAYASAYHTALKSLFSGATAVQADGNLDPFAAVRTGTTYKVGTGLMRILQDAIPEVLS